MIVLITKRRREAREDDMRRAATSRGSQFDSRSESGARVHRWKGTTDGVSWMAE